MRDGVVQMDSYVLINGVVYRVWALERVKPGWMHVGFRRHLGHLPAPDQMAWFSSEALF